MCYVQHKPTYKQPLTLRPLLAPNLCKHLGAGQGMYPGVAALLLVALVLECNWHISCVGVVFQVGGEQSCGLVSLN